MPSAQPGRARVDLLQAAFDFPKHPLAREDGADGVELDDSEIGPNVTISTGTTVRGSRLRDTIVGEKVRLEGCVLHDSLVGNEAVLRNVSGQVDIGDHSVVEADTR